MNDLSKTAEKNLSVVQSFDAPASPDPSLSVVELSDASASPDPRPYSDPLTCMWGCGSNPTTPGHHAIDRIDILVLIAVVDIERIYVLR
jgi:hypothetical protein